MGSREEILSAIRRQKPDAVPLPKLEGDWIVYEDKPRQFQKMTEAVGGQCERVGNREELNERLSELPCYAEARKVCSLVPGVGQSHVDPKSVEDPHDLEDVDVAILPGEFGVAENAAVWTSDEGLKHRVLPFLTQHLVLVIPAGEILDNMHQAYTRLRGAKKSPDGEPKGRFFDAPRFGVFVSGPSKTADIEQSLVIGAHGPRSLTVYLLDD